MVIPLRIVAAVSSATFLHLALILFFVISLAPQGSVSNGDADFFLTSPNVSSVERATESSGNYFGCGNPGCSINRTWQISGLCESLVFTASVVETDFNHANEYVNVSINGMYLSSCSNLGAPGHNCTHTMTKCDDVTNIDMTSFLDPNSNLNFINVQFDSSLFVDACPVEVQDVGDQFLRVGADLVCTRGDATFAPTPVPTVPTMIPSEQPTPEVDLYFDASEVQKTAYFGCTSPGCSETRTWQITGLCEQLLLTIEIVETDYNADSEYVDIYVNNNYISSCDNIDENCTWISQTCDDVKNRDVTEFIDPTQSINYLTVTSDTSPAVSSCPFAHESGQQRYLQGSATLVCNRYNGTLFPSLQPTAPTMQPTGAPVVPEDLVQNAVLTTGSHILSCSEGGCVNTHTWRVRGQCSKMYVSASVVETDFGFPSTEKVHMYVNDHYIGACDELDRDCTFDWVDCRNLTNVDVTHLIDTNASENLISVTLDLTLHVNTCPFVVNGSEYYLYSEVSVSCFSENAGFTYAPTSPTLSPTVVPTEPTALPTASPGTDYSLRAFVNASDASGIVQDEQEFSCTSPGCEVFRDWQVLGACSQVWLSASVLETKSVAVLVNGNSVGTCESVFANCTRALISCAGDAPSGEVADIADAADVVGYGWDITHLLENGAKGVSGLLELEFDAEVDPRDCALRTPSFTFYVFVRVTLTCVVATDSVGGGTKSDDGLSEDMILMIALIVVGVVALLVLLLFLAMRYKMWRVQQEESEYNSNELGPDASRLSIKTRSGPSMDGMDGVESSTTVSSSRPMRGKIAKLPHVAPHVANHVVPLTKVSTNSIIGGAGEMSRGYSGSGARSVNDVTGLSPGAARAHSPVGYLRVSTGINLGHVQEHDNELQDSQDWHQVPINGPIGPMGSLGPAGPMRKSASLGNGYESSSAQGVYYDH